ncbi:MAG TPA: ribonuclease J [Roseiarcus sp.]|nr:ribonuclease J [Roseiarcus sp.]
MSQENQLVFASLGGLGEIGMNCALYGFGPANKRSWLMVDLGVSFAGEDLPGIDLILPDVAFIEKAKRDLLGIVITHAHEDHIGALIDLWPRLGAKVYATRFAASLLEARRLSEPNSPHIPVDIVEQGGRAAIGPFDVEFVAVAHSIPESCAVAIRTEAGLVIHTGDWKIDPTPLVGAPIDEARFKALGEEGVLALICDSTNVIREGESPSEAEVAKTLGQLVAGARGRVIVTAFASNVARLRAAAQAGIASGRQVLLLGRAMERVISVARECGYLDGVPPFRGGDGFDLLPRDKILALATGSQGEPRAAMARLADNDHPVVSLAPGDMAIFSSRPIPGNEKAVSKVVNGLIAQGVEVVTDRTNLVHVSGHPRRAELAKLYAWTRPRVVVPAHGEALHLAEHAEFARAQGISEVVLARDGDVVLLDAAEAKIIGQIEKGRLYKDGAVVLAPDDACILDRRRLSFAGVVSIALAVTAKGDLAGDPDVMISGLPKTARNGAGVDEIVDAAIFETFDSMPRPKRRDADVLSGAVERAVRNAVNSAWGKKPSVHVLVVEV